MAKLFSYLAPYSENKLLLVVISVLIGAISTKLIPALWSLICYILLWLGKRIGGRFAYHSFCKHYLDWVITEHRELKLTGIVSSNEAKKPTLEQIFVSLHLDKQEAEGAPLTETHLEIASLRSLCALLVQQREFAKNDEERERFSELISSIQRKIVTFIFLRVASLFPGRIPRHLIDEAVFVRNWLAENGSLIQDALRERRLRDLLAKHNKLAILGGPGSGKTTLLQYITLTFAKEKAGDPKLRNRGILRKRFGVGLNWKLPIFIRLSSLTSLLADASTDRDRSILELIPRTLSPELQMEGLAQAYFSRQFETGKCLVLFDGLDEVPADDEFQRVKRSIQGLMARFPKNQYIVTSRVAGWRGGVSGEISAFHVGDLTDLQVDRFIDIWYAAVEKNSTVSGLKGESRAERRARESRAAKSANDLKETLRRNLGIRRLVSNPMLLSIVALVHRSLAILPRERGKLYEQCCNILLEQWDISRGIRVDDSNLKLEQKQEIMRRLAVALHTGEIGDQNGGREAKREEFEATIASLLPILGRPMEDAARLLQILIERSGVIVERQRGVLAFGHHTFQEYFAAQYLARGERPQHRSFLLDDSRLLSDWWREVLLLYSGLISDSSDLIKEIIALEESGPFRPRLRLGGLCLGEAVSVRNVEVRRTVVQGLLRIRESDDGISWGDDLLSLLVDYLVRWARLDDWYSASALGFVRSAPREKEVCVQLWSALSDKQDFVRSAALRALSLAPCERMVRGQKAKVQQLLRDESALVRESALGLWLEPEHAGQVVSLLLDKSEGVREAAEAAIDRSKWSLKLLLASLRQMSEAAESDAQIAAARIATQYKESGGEEVVSILMRALTSDSWKVESAARDLVADWGGSGVDDALLERSLREILNVPWFPASRVKTVMDGIVVPKDSPLLRYIYRAFVAVPILLAATIAAPRLRKRKIDTLKVAAYGLVVAGVRPSLAMFFYRLLDERSRSLREALLSVISVAEFQGEIGEELPSRILTLMSEGSGRDRKFSAAALRVARGTSLERDAVRRLVFCCKSSDKELVVNAVYSLAAIGAHSGSASEIVDHLVELLSSMSPVSRAAAVFGLSELWPSIVERGLESRVIEAALLPIRGGLIERSRDFLFAGIDGIYSELMYLGALVRCGVRAKSSAIAWSLVEAFRKADYRSEENRVSVFRVAVMPRVGFLLEMIAHHGGDSLDIDAVLGGDDLWLWWRRFGLPGNPLVVVGRVLEAVEAESLVLSLARDEREFLRGSGLSLIEERSELLKSAEIRGALSSMLSDRSDEIRRRVISLGTRLGWPSMGDPAIGKMIQILHDGNRALEELAWANIRRLGRAGCNS